jgi:hypothetical protein
VFFSVDQGAKWTKLAGGSPTISFRDLVIQKRENDLVGATFGRSFYILDDYTPLRTLSGEALQNDTLLFPVRDAHWYIQRIPLGDFEEGGKSSQGDDYFVASNPPFGAVVTYYLKEDILSLSEARLKQEETARSNDSDTPYPGWEALRNEQQEDPPAIVLTITDSEGGVVNHIEGPVTAGFHRVAWNLRYPTPDAWTPEDAGDQYIRFSGPLAKPGSYTVSIAKRVNGQTTDLGLSETFNVKPIHEPMLQAASAEDAMAFELRLDQMQRQVKATESALKTTLTELDAIKSTLLRSSAPMALRDRARELELRVMGLQERVSGNKLRENAGDPGPVSISRRVSVAKFGTFRSTYGPTPTHTRALEIAENEFETVKAALKQLLVTDLPALRSQLDEAGVPWTPGRGTTARD